MSLTTSPCGSTSNVHVCSGRGLFLTLLDCLLVPRAVTKELSSLCGRALSWRVMGQGGPVFSCGSGEKGLKDAGKCQELWAPRCSDSVVRHYGLGEKLFSRLREASEFPLDPSRGPVLYRADIEASSAIYQQWEVDIQRSGNQPTSPDSK